MWQAANICLALPGLAWPGQARQGKAGTQTFKIKKYTLDYIFISWILNVSRVVSEVIIDYLLVVIVIVFLIKIKIFQYMVTFLSIICKVVSFFIAYGQTIPHF